PRPPAPRPRPTATGGCSSSSVACPFLGRMAAARRLDPPRQGRPSRTHHRAPHVGSQPARPAARDRRRSPPTAATPSIRAPHPPGFAHAPPRPCVERTPEVVLDDVDAIEIGPDLAVPRAELRYRATRAGGPGGQHVNTSATRVELTWDVAASPSLSEQQRTR